MVIGGGIGKMVVELVAEKGCGGGFEFGEDGNVLMMMLVEGVMVWVVAIVGSLEVEVSE